MAGVAREKRKSDPDRMEATRTNRAIIELLLHHEIGCFAKQKRLRELVLIRNA
jgi:hypothetical protein